MNTRVNYALKSVQLDKIDPLNLFIAFSLQVLPEDQQNKSTMGWKPGEGDGTLAAQISRRKQNNIFIYEYVDFESYNPS